MITRPTLSVFPTRDPEGVALCRELALLARDLGFEVKDQLDASVRNYTYACWHDDVVVLDATVTGERDHNYPMAIPVALDHVLVVSRTYLPINFYALRDAIFEPGTAMLVYGTPFYPNSLSNSEILRWLQLQLADLLPFLPRPKKEKGLIGSVLRGMDRSMDRADGRRKQYGQIFLSYRSSDWGRVAALKTRIERGEFHDGEHKAVRCFPPNTLSDEVMTEQRRWQMLSMIDRFVGPAGEVWVCESDNYYDSWWTQGELMTLAYRRQVGFRDRNPPRLRIFNLEQNLLSDAPEDYLPAMTKAHRQRMARWFANCDTARMGVESIAAIRLLAHLPLIGRHSYLRDHVWSDEFWRYPILDCKVCRQIGKHRNRVDIDSFLWTRDPGFFRLSPGEMRDWARLNLIVCPQCKSSYRVEKGPPQLLWLPVINGHRTGEYIAALFNVESIAPDDFSILPLPTYRIV